NVTYFICVCIYNLISPTAVAAAVPERCCFNFIDFPIPADKIVSALKTGSKCPAPGVVVTTKKPLEFCVKPDEEWVKKVMNNLKTV
uniref:Chemokine interleukin-8-like domain-containing protein n=1 Tax=Cyprinus carpio TaxID=7962 RepID=A0A8C1P991_CYPCA